MHPKKTNPFLNLPSAVILAGGLIALAIIWTQKPAPAPAAAKADAAQSAPAAPAQPQVAPVTAADHIFGNPNAPIKIVEYSDPSCPYCKLFYPTMQQVMKDYGASGDVAWVYRAFPLNNIHPNAEHESEALECAASLGGNTAFWSMVDKIYSEPQSATGLDQSKLPAFAKAAGLDTAKFDACLSGGQMKSVVAASELSGNNAGVNGTPSSFIVTSAGRTVAISGAQPLATVKQTIDALLSEAQK